MRGVSIVLPDDGHVVGTTTSRSFGAIRLGLSTGLGGGEGADEGFVVRAWLPIAAGERAGCRTSRGSGASIADVFHSAHRRRTLVLESW
jgi:hypothetical protein